MQFTGQTKVFATQCSAQYNDIIQSLQEQGNADILVGCLAYYDRPLEGWTEIGTATITVTLADPDTVVANEIASLQQQLQRERAESQVRQNAITDRISKLLAITDASGA